MQGGGNSTNADPTDVHSLCRFLGMVNYLAKFLPCLSDETEVLRKLTERDAEWCWLPAHADALAHVNVTHHCGYKITSAEEQDTFSDFASLFCCRSFYC